MSPSANFGPVSVQLARASKGVMTLESIKISKEPWFWKYTVAIRSSWMVRWPLKMPSSPTMRHGWIWQAIGRAKQVAPIWNCLETVAWSWLLACSLQYIRDCASARWRRVSFVRVLAQEHVLFEQWQSPSSSQVISCAAAQASRMLVVGSWMGFVTSR